jgi:hypothetical protein
MTGIPYLLEGLSGGGVSPVRSTIDFQIRSIRSGVTGLVSYSRFSSDFVILPILASGLQGSRTV